MASRLLVAVALFALCHSSPIEELRGKRSYTKALGSSIGYAGKNTASAVVAGDKADAQAVNENGALAHDALGNNIPGQAYAVAGNSDSAGEAVYRGYAHPAYYPIPAPATVLTYQKYVEPEIPSQIVYEAPAPSHAQSSAVLNNGYGSVNSDANSGFGSASSNANAQGSGQSAVSSLAQNNGHIIEEPAVIAAKGIHSVYTPVGHNSASSNANTNGYHSSANSAARVGAVPTRKSISWRFGTAYDQPAAYGAAKAAATNFGQGTLSSAANTIGDGSAQSAAENHGYGSSVRSATNSFGAGSGNANANINGNYAVLRSENVPNGYGGISSSAASQNGGSAISQAGTDAAGREYVDSAARSNSAGSAQSAAHNGVPYGVRSNGGWGGRIASTSHTSGQGNAASSARGQGVSTGYRVVSSNANSGTYGSAQSKAYSL